MSMLSAEICIILIICFNGSQCIALKTVYTTPLSNLQIKLIDLDKSVNCDFYNEGSKIKKSIIHAATVYDTTKYQLITVKEPKVTIQAPTTIGRFPIRLFFRKLERKELKIRDRLLIPDNESYRRKGSPKHMTFTLNTSQPISDNSVPLDESFVKFFFEFQLKIKNVSKKDDGMYQCVVITPWIDIVVSPLQFSHQTDDNIIYGTEQKTMNITCTIIPGYKSKELSIKLNGTILKTNESQTVTFSFTPNRHDNFKDYECMGDQQLPFVRVKLLVNYAPTVTVVARNYNFDCFANGFPQTYTFDHWEHQSDQGEHIRFLDGLRNGTLNLQKPELTYQLNGRYTCTVSNGIPDVNGTMYQRGFTSLQFTGAPIFTPENRNVKHGKLGQPLILSIVLYSNPYIEDIWIESVVPGTFQNKTKDDFKMLNTTFVYTAFENKGNISGYELILETNNLRSYDFHEYTMWTKNELGVDFYRFEIIEIVCYKNTSMDKTQFLTSSSIAAGLLVYIIVIHSCFRVKRRSILNKSRTSSVALHYHSYDEIESISYQTVNFRRLPTDMHGSSQQPMIIRSSQTEISHTDTNNHLTTNVRSDATSTAVLQENISNAIQQNLILEETSNEPSPLSSKNKRQSYMSYCEETDTSSNDSVKSFPRRRNQDIHCSIVNRPFTYSTGSEESRINSNYDLSSAFNVDDGYENPYQILMQEFQDTHTYNSLMNQSEKLDSSTTTDVKDYVNLRF